MNEVRLGEQHVGLVDSELLGDLGVRHVPGVLGALQPGEVPLRSRLESESATASRGTVVQRLEVGAGLRRS